MNFTISIKEGFGNLRFDMPIEDICQLLGEASEVENIDNGLDESTTVLHYEDLQLTLFFEGELPILSCIDTDNTDCTLFGHKIYDCTEKEIVQLMTTHSYYEQDIETEAWGERRVSFSEANIDFFFENEKLVSIVFGK